MRDRQLLNDTPQSDTDERDEGLAPISPRLVTLLVDHLQRVRQHLEHAQTTARHAQALYEAQGED